MYGNHTPEGDVIEQDRSDRSSYCEHGTFIGNAFGGDYLCGPCESGDDMDDDRHKALEEEVLRLMPKTYGLWVEVTEFAGNDDPSWTDPAYIIAEDDAEREYFDAVCDLDSDTIENQAKFVVNQLLNG